MKRTLVGLVVCGAVGAGTLQFAVADSKSISDSPSDATPNSLDVVSATAGHKGDHKLVHTVKVDGILNSSNPDRQILLQLSFDKDSVCESELIWPPSGITHIVHCGVGPTPKEGTITQVSADTLRFAFTEHAIGSPDKYNWRVITRDSVSSLIDAAPNQDGATAVYVRHRLP